MAARLHFRSLIVTGVLVAMVLAVGPRDRVARAGDPAQEGSWGSRFNWGSPPIIPIHMTVLPDGRVLSWKNLDPDRGCTPALVWDGSTFTEFCLQGTDLFCSGHALMADGKVFIAGGNIQAGPDQHIGSDHANTFDYSTNQWVSLPVMNAGRWYPTVTTLNTGEMLVTSGDIQTGQPNTIPQVWQVSSQPPQWKTLSGADKNLSLYPWMYLAPDARVFYAGEKRLKWFLNTTGSGSWTSGPASSTDRSKGSSAMYEVTSGGAKILIMGGELNSPPGVSNTAEFIDLKAPSPAWQGTQMMSRARKDHNVELPRFRGG